MVNITNTKKYISRHNQLAEEPKAYAPQRGKAIFTSHPWLVLTLSLLALVYVYVTIPMTVVLSGTESTILAELAASSGRAYAWM